MSLHVLYNGRKKAVKCGPNTPLQAVLEAACKEHGVGDPHAFALVHKKVRCDCTEVGGCCVGGMAGGWGGLLGPGLPVGWMGGWIERRAGLTDPCLTPLNQ